MLELGGWQHCAHQPIRFERGRIQDQTDPALKTRELADLYRTFLRTQYAVIEGWFGQERTRKAFGQVLRQLNPDLQEVFAKYRFKDILKEEA